MARKKNDSDRVDLAAFDQAGARVLDTPLTSEVEGFISKVRAVA